MNLSNHSFNLTQRFFSGTHLKKLLFVFVLGIVSLALFPYGVLAEESRIFRFIIYRVFDSEWSHIVGHFGIFSFIGTAVLLFFPKLLSYPILYLSVMLNLAWIQEFLQLATFKRRPINFGELKDLGIDLAAAVFVFIGFVLYRHIQRRRKPQVIPTGDD